MAKMITFASGWYKERYDTLYCKIKDKASLYDLESKTNEYFPAKLFMQTASGDMLEVTDFRVVTNTNRKEDKHPTHEVKIKLED